MLIKFLLAVPLLVTGAVHPYESDISAETLQDIDDDTTCDTDTLDPIRDCHRRGSEPDGTDADPNNMNYITNMIFYNNPSYVTNPVDGLRGQSPYMEDGACCYEYAIDHWYQKLDCKGNNPSLSHFAVNVVGCEDYLEDTGDNSFAIVSAAVYDWDYYPNEETDFFNAIGSTEYGNDGSTCTKGLKWDEGFTSSQDLRVYKVCVTWTDIDANKECMDPESWYQQKSGTAFDFEEIQVPACYQGACAQVGAEFSPPHYCRCVRGDECPDDETDPNSFFCHPISLIANRLGVTLGAGEVDCGNNDDYVCCCHCESCPDPLQAGGAYEHAFEDLPGNQAQ